MRGITLVYPHNKLKANDGVDLSVQAGEIHALVGENGAGKTTLMKILYGLLSPQEGEIVLNGGVRHFRHSQDAAREGIGMVPQHFKLIPEFTVAQNVVLGREPRKGPFFSQRRALREVGEVIREHRFNLDPAVAVASLSVSQRQQVEILKALYRRARLLILDEPTAVLTEQETAKLFETLKTLQKQGKTIILITHKLSEVMEISQRVSVMRQGRMVAVRNTAETERRELSRLMVGREVLFEITKTPLSAGEEVFSIRGGTLRRRSQAKPLLKDVSLAVRRGKSWESPPWRETA